MAKTLFGNSGKKTDELLQHLLSFPPHPPPVHPLPDDEYEDRISRLLYILKNTSNKVLTSGTSGGGDLLDILDPSINSLPYLYTLLAHASLNDTVTKNGGESLLIAGQPLWHKCVTFLESFDSRQVRYAGEMWRDVIELVAEMARLAGQPTMAIRPIRSAILRMDPVSSTFTTNHLLFVTLCLEARSYRAALPILDNDILEFPPSVPAHSHNILPPSINRTSSAYITSSSGISGKISYQHHLEYHVYGAMVYMTLEKWARSLEFLSYAITAPATNSISLIMVEAYRKWLLVGLIHTGKMLRLPPNTSNLATRVFHASSRAYEGVCEIFERGDAKKLQDEIEAGQTIWAEDHNTGLLKLVLHAHRRFALLSLQKTYSSLPLSQVLTYDPLGASLATPTMPHEKLTEQLLLSMIASGELSATLSSSPSSSSTSTSPTILRFTSSTSQNSPAAQLRRIEESIERLKQLNAHVKDADRKLAIGKDYIVSTLKAKTAKATKDAGTGASSSTGTSGGVSGASAGSKKKDSSFGPGAESAGKSLIMEVDEDIMEGF